MLTWVVFECFATFDWFSEDLWLEFTHELVSVFPFRATTLTLFLIQYNNPPSFYSAAFLSTLRSFVPLVALLTLFIFHGVYVCVCVCQRWYICFRWSLHSPFLILSFLPIILLCWLHSLVCFCFGSLQMEYRTNCPVKQFFSIITRRHFSLFLCFCFHSFRIWFALVVLLSRLSLVSANKTRINKTW